jgi:hypothetical protein
MSAPPVIDPTEGGQEADPADDWKEVANEPSKEKGCRISNMRQPR